MTDQERNASMDAALATMRREAIARRHTRTAWYWVDEYMACGEGGVPCAECRDDQ